jgi:hypothetical protein
VVLARASVLVVAVIACAWFVVGIRQAHDTAAATSIITHRGGLSAAQVAHARSLLGAAQSLNPDSQVELVRGRLDLIEHDLMAARRSIEGVLRREPLNLQGWALLAQTVNGDRRLLTLTIINIARLDPRG